MTKYNKYEIYVDKTELATYIEVNKIVDRYILPNEFDDKDFWCVYKMEGFVNFLNKDGMIDAIAIGCVSEVVKNPTKVTAEEFLIAIGYLKRSENINDKPVTTEKLKAEDVYYIDSYYPSETDFVGLHETACGEIYLFSRERSNRTEIGLSPDSLISLGKDLIQIGIQKQIEEESNED